jgi:hypothetical protein
MEFLDNGATGNTSLERQKTLSTILETHKPPLFTQEFSKSAAFFP